MPSRPRSRRRRPYGWGNCTPMAGGSWEAYHGSGTQREYAYFPTELAAVEWLNAIYEDKQRVRAGLAPVRPGEVRFEQLWQAYLGTVRNDVDPGTLRGYEAIGRLHLLPAFGSSPLGLVTYEAIETYRDCKLNGTLGPDGTPLVPVAPGARTRLSPQTVVNHLNLLSSVLKEGMRRRWCDRNEAKLVRHPPRAKDTAEVRAFTFEETDAILALLDDGDPALVAQLALGLGLRIGETLAIEEADCGPDAAGVWGVLVTRSLGVGATRAETVRDHTKTRHGRRFLPCSPTARALLEAAIAHCTDRPPGPDGRRTLFRSARTGGHVSPANFRNRHWLPAVGCVAMRGLDEKRLDALARAVTAEFAVVVRLIAATPGARLQDVRTLPADAYDATTGTLTYVDGRGGTRCTVLDATTATLVEAGLARSGRLCGGRGATGGLLVSGSRGQPLSRDRIVNAVMRTGFDAVGVSVADSRIHNLRHTWATVQLERRVLDESVVEAYAGHAKGYTRLAYGHVQDRMREQFADIWGPPAPGPGTRP